MEVSIWALAPEWKSSRTRATAWYDWFLKLWFVAVVVAYVKRALGLGLVDGPLFAPLALKEDVASRPSAWQISAGDADRLVVFMAGQENGVDALCVRTSRDAFAGTKIVSIPGAPSKFSRWARFAWDQGGKHVAVALFDTLHVFRIKLSGAALLRGTFQLPECGAAGVALVESSLSHSVFVLLFDGRLLRLVLPARVNFGLYDCKGAVSTHLGDDWQPTCLAYHHERKLFVIGGVLRDGSVGAVSMFSACSLASADRVAKHEWSSWRDNSSMKLPGCLAHVQLSPNGSLCLCVNAKGGGVTVLSCDLDDPTLSPLQLPFTSVSSIDWFDDDRVVAASFLLGRMELKSLKDGAATALSEKQPVTCSHLTRAFNGRFFFLNCAHRERAASQIITREKVLQLQRDSERAATFWGSFVNSVWSYVSYFHLPTLNTRHGVITREEFHVTVMFDSFPPQTLVEKLVSEKRFDDALDIAVRHALDTDAVFQARLSAVQHLSQASAAENLAAIKNDEWVLAFCLNRVSASVDEVRLLIRTGLARCDVAKVSDVKREAFRLLLQECGERLETYLEAMGGKFDGSDYFDFKRQDLTVSAIVHAMHGRTALVRILWRRHLRQLCQFRFALLDSFPETVSCEEYAEVLPREEDEEKDRDEEMAWSKALRRALVASEGAVPIVEEAWLPFLRSLVFAKEKVRVLDMEFAPISPSQQPLYAREWFAQRALAIDDESGQLTLVSQLLKQPTKIPNPKVERLLRHVEEALVLVYELKQPFGSLRQYTVMSAADRCSRFLQALQKNNVISILAHTRQNFFRDSDFSSLLQQFVCRCSLAGGSLLSVMELVFAQSTPATSFEARPFADVRHAMQSVLQAAYLSPRPEDIHIWRRVLKNVPTRLSHVGDAELLSLHDELDCLEAHLDACEVLARLGVAVALNKVRQTSFDATIAAVKKTLHRGRGDWNGLLRDLLMLRSSLFHDSVAAELAHAHFVAFLVTAKQPLERVLRACAECEELAPQFVRDALDQVFDACNGLDSADVSYVAALLEQYPSSPLCELTQAAALLRSARVQLIPLQLRVWKNQTSDDVLKRVCAAVARSPDATPLSQSDCETVCRLIGVNGQNAALELVAAFGEADLLCGRLDRAIETARANQSSRLAAKCMESKQIVWRDFVVLAGIVAREDFGKAIMLLEQRVAQSNVQKKPRETREPVEYDPLLDDPMLMPVVAVPVVAAAPKKKEGDKKNEEEDDITGIAKKAWSNFFGAN